jgi:hypothetical protein
MLCGLPTVTQEAIGDCLPFDPFPFDQNGLASPEVDIGGRQVGDALVISQVIVVSDEGLDLGFEIARQDTVLERLMQRSAAPDHSTCWPSPCESMNLVKAQDELSKYKRAQRS